MFPIKRIASFLILFLSLFSAPCASGAVIFPDDSDEITVYPGALHDAVVTKGIPVFLCNIAGRTENKKLIAILFAIALGPLGVHRLYLGTDWKVPVIYAATLGGGFGILPLADIIAMLLTKDVQRYVGNNRLVMWIE